MRSFLLGPLIVSKCRNFGAYASLPMHSLPGASLVPELDKERMLISQTQHPPLSFAVCQRLEPPTTFPSASNLFHQDHSDSRAVSMTVRIHVPRNWTKGPIPFEILVIDQRRLWYSRCPQIYPSDHTAAVPTLSMPGLQPPGRSSGLHISR